MSLRVAIVTQDEPFYMPAFFEAFFEELSEEVVIDSVTILDLLDDSMVDLATRMYGLYGPWTSLRRGIEFVYRKTLSSIGGSYSVANIAKRNGVTVKTRESVNESEFVSYLNESGIDVLLSVSAPEVFDPAVLNAPNWGCVNVHTALLPEYRGILPTFWALYHGEDEIGVTVHTMVEEIDRGKIVRQTTFPVASNDTLDDVINRGKRVGGEEAAAALATIADGTVDLTKMDGEGSYYSFPTADDRREFEKRGGEVL
ncbi:formyltransferase family protein [Halopenitus sp. H-Gu1]|uniref:formyltransferase family protein n=1 Tax=Halopenitus sp. H-Gu1 TaxID=3242697 RepID=UPI00359D70A2